MQTPQDSLAPGVSETPSSNRAPSKSTKTNQIVLLVILLVILGFVLASVFLTSRVSLEERARQAFVQKVASESGGQISVSDFLKTDGQKGELAGVPIYKLSFKATLRFRNDGTWYTGDSLTPNQLSFTLERSRPQSGALAAFENSRRGGRQVDAFKSEFVSGVMLGEKSENGWTFSLTSGQVE